MKRWALTLAVLAVAFGAAAQDANTRSISKEKFLDKLKGAWAGQMIGVVYGANFEFISNAKPIEKEMGPWKPQRVKESLFQDDVYVEMTFLKSLETYGLDVTPEQAGKDFGESKYELWHANKWGRENIRKGIMPPLSGNPAYNDHADDIDFQIESDLFGIICPGLPHESNRLGSLFGSIMNYGDGVYGGLFVSGMYAAAYFEDNDVEKVLDAGLACIPQESQYYKCIADVVKWHKENPNDWLKTWHLIEDKWQKDDDCQPNDPTNIDAKLNGAYIVMGLLYGDGNLEKTMEISTRCGQDADCNPSSAAGVLCCMKGYAALGDATSGIPAMADEKFSFTDYSFNTLVPASQGVAEKVIARAGGKVTDDAYLIPVQEPQAPETFEQWVRQH
jgi:hypothetical protein